MWQLLEQKQHRTPWLRCAGNTDAVRWSSRVALTRSMSGTCSSTTSLIPRPPARGNATKRLRAPSGTSHRCERTSRTEQTYESVNAKRVYYLSMEFLIGRSLTNSITNLLLGPLVSNAVKQTSLDWLGLLEEEPDAALGNGGLGRLAACFLDSMATMQLPAMGYGLRYEYGMFRQSIEDGWQHEQPDNWLRRPDPWEVARPDEK